MTDQYAASRRSRKTSRSRDDLSFFERRLRTLEELREAEKAARYASPAILVGIGDPRGYALDLHIVPVFGMRWHHRLVWITVFAVLSVTVLMLLAERGCPPGTAALLIGLAVWGAAFLCFYHALFAPSLFIMLIAAIQRVGFPSYRISLVLGKIRTGLRRDPLIASGVVVAVYLLGLFLIVCAAKALGVGVDIGKLQSLAILAFLATAFPVCLIFSSTYFPNKSWQVPRNPRNGDIVRYDLGELRTVLHTTVQSRWAFRWILFWQSLAPLRVLNPSIGGERNGDTLQSAMTTIMLARILNESRFAGLMFVGYPVIGGWAMLVLLSYLRAAPSAALSFGAIVLATGTGIYLLKAEERLGSALTLTEGQREAMPPWLLKQAPENSYLRERLTELRVTQQIGAGVFGVLFIGYISMLGAAKPDLPAMTGAGPAGNGHFVFRCLPMGPPHLLTTPLPRSRPADVTPAPPAA